MSNQLIPVFAGTINNQPAQLVDARFLHEFLEVGKRFASWITDRIKQYDFIENQEFILISQNRETRTGGTVVKDYHLTLDMAKELSMVERNDKGREARRYFIDCEKQLHQPSAPLKPITGAITIAELEARNKYHTDALAELKNVSVIVSGAEYLAIQQALNSKVIDKLFFQTFASNPAENHHNLWTEAERKALLTYRAQGLSYRKIAAKMGRTYDSIKHAVAKYILGAKA